MVALYFSRSSRPTIVLIGSSGAGTVTCAGAAAGAACWRAATGVNVTETTAPTAAMNTLARIELSSGSERIAVATCCDRQRPRAARIWRFNSGLTWNFASSAIRT